MNLKTFNQQNLFDATIDFFKQLNINFNVLTKLSVDPKSILKEYNKNDALLDKISELYYIGMISDEIFGDKQNNISMEEALSEQNEYDGIILFAIEMKNKPSRHQISELTRAFNRINRVRPVALLFRYKYEDKIFISLSISERFKYKQAWREGEKVGKIIVLRDINTDKPHAGHERILINLSKHNATNYNELHAKLIEVFDLEILNKQFYKDIFEWYNLAKEQVKFPNGEVEMNLIRLITRIIFVWFIKEKNLVPENLFDEKYIQTILKDFEPNKLDSNDSSASLRTTNHKLRTNYYNAILQNLFFATLNQKIDDRKFAKDEGYPANINTFDVKNLFRYESMFKISEEEVKKLFSSIPFLNGGIFDCLDKETEDGEITIDGFSRRKKKRAIIPDSLFFGQDDKNEVGLFNILNKYKFTVVENTPFEEDVALDPELLGKVFENLLGTYNPETQETARKQTGSFYTPREIVDYMVDESLLAYLMQHCKMDTDKKLRSLLAGDDVDFEELEKEKIINALNEIKILDPACGSGAFPMGILHKMVYILQKLDQGNMRWKDLQREKYSNVAKDIVLSAENREELKKNLNEMINDIFDNNSDDYGRKLFLIENCIYGIDIQPIAIQISKLRFFISLVIDQKVDKDKNNYGVLALPNLETKFVAANTLIALEKPETQIHIFMEEFKDILNELKENTHLYFSATDRRDKESLRKKEKKILEKLAKKLEKNGYKDSQIDKIRAFDRYDQNAKADWFDIEIMFGLKDGFDIVIGNPPYINTKVVADATKKLFEKEYGFSDDTYSHFFFKGYKLLVNGGGLTYIIPKTFWTTQTKRNLRDLLLSNHINYIFDTANPFTSMVDTCITSIQKIETKNNEIKFLDGSKDLLNPQQYIIDQNIYLNTQNSVIFKPTPENLNIQKLYGNKVKELYNTWWDKISTSKNIEKNKVELEAYRKSLKPGDITLLGCITEGGQGLATANNGKYIAVRKSTKWAKNILESRPKKLAQAIKEYKIEISKIAKFKDTTEYLQSLSEKQIAKLFDELKEKHGRDIFGQGYIYRLIDDSEVADVENLTEKEKQNGIPETKKHYVPYDKGDKDGNRWYLETPFAIAWSQKNVAFLKANSGKKGEGMPVVRNPQFYFKEGFCWTNVLNPQARLLKAKMKDKSVNDVGSMSLCSIVDLVPNYFIVILLNSELLFNYYREYINCTVNIQINDIRQLPIFIPTLEQLEKCKPLYNRAIELKHSVFRNIVSELDIEHELFEIEYKLNEFVENLYYSV